MEGAGAVAEEVKAVCVILCQQGESRACAQVYGALCVCVRPGALKWAGEGRVL